MTEKIPELGPIDYGNPAWQKWLSALTPEDQRLVTDMPFDVVLQLPNDKLDKRAKLRHEYMIIQRAEAALQKKTDGTKNANGKAEKDKEEEERVPLTEEITEEMSFNDVAAVLESSIKKDMASKEICFAAMLLAQSENDQLNIAFVAESSSGKSYLPLELATFFPDKELVILGGASPQAFFHDASGWNAERKVFIVDLESKILILQDMPHFQLLEKLRPLLSHERKELTYKIADRSQKSGLRTKTIIVRGFPSVIFCTARLKSDPQEKTRLVLLSPSTDQAKLEESLRLIAMRKGNPEEYKRKVEDDPERLRLSKRIKAIRQSGIREVLILDYEAAYKRFLADHPNLQARHQRDFPRILSLAKAHALLNLFNRERRGNAIIATQADIDTGFALYKEIEEPNML
ncbi:hypothetical protein, partial [Nitrososphaera sp.]|uniref:hypothetical protein n=1 Tax=Nitrososphaera sp. TaxID=1971748 RepID=UPI002EDB20CD